ncbi:MAG: FecR domain-containing protein, partial [Pirellulales bacterium]|nr:FecR domain-containing protein [Pirellulales bacterium]
MNTRERHFSPDEELRDLIAATWNGQIGPRQRDRLEQILGGDKLAQEYYLTCMALHGKLLWQHRGAAERGVENLEIWKFGDLAKAEPPSAIPSLSSFPSPLSSSFVGGPVFSYMAATVVLCLMLLGAWTYKISHVRDQHYVADSRRQTASGPSEQPELVFVGRVTGMKDCRWSDPNTHTYIGASAPLGREYVLASGLMEITYQSGAKVILEGPCSYKIESSAGGFLTKGKLTANLRTQGSKPKARSSEPSPLSSLPSPLFSVRTPTAVVTDLGTEFGVEVDANGETTSHVFQGSVQVQIL